uniref:Cysteine-type endopeptidase n=1 Tax=Riptortus pedestris TaxID=329032 RepID=R4WDK4_RIPPE|nr:cysteine-type endopeptidase [Riptortus pedestris]
MGSLHLFCFLLVVGAIGSTNAGLCAGCPEDKDPNDAEVRNHLTKVVKIQNAKSNDEDLNIVEVKEAKSQVVAGIKWIIKFVAQGAKSKKLYECETSWVNQAWVSDQPQIIDFECNPKKSKRDVGASKDVKPEELEQVKELVDLGMETLDELDADDNKRVVVRIIDAKKKLVNGIMYEVAVEVKMTSCPEEGLTTKECLSEEVGPQKICKLQIYRSFADKSPHNAKVVKSECDTAKSRSVLDSVDSSTHIGKAAEFATKRLSNSMNSIKVKGLVNILESSHLYKTGSHITSLTLELGDTNCTKQHMEKESECAVLPGVENHLVCSVDVIHDESSDKMRLQGFNCKDVKHDKSLTNRARRALVGGERPLDLSSERIVELKDFVSSHFNSYSDSVYTKAVVNVLSASYKTVSGRVLNVLVEVANTNCFKTAETKNECSIQELGRLVCKVGIWEKPWLDKKEIISNECSPVEPNPEVLGVSASDEHFEKFKKFTERFNKAYPTVNELKKRFRVFRANMKKADFLQKHEQGTAVYGASIFADLSSSEFKKHYLGLKKRTSPVPTFEQKQADIPEITLPEEYDWRNFNVVTPVKNQGMCGSCWAFSVTGNIEGQYAIKTGSLVSLSEQELVDCDKYDSGCQGGLFDTAYHAVEEIGGLEGESDYPYTGRDDKCHFDASEVRVSISSSVNISHNETDMAKWLVANGPISIGLNANAMQLYLGGVSHPWKFLCSPEDMDHGVLIVGYGIHKTWLLQRHLPYWLIKNSWGPHWGHQGYYMLYRGDGSCGVNSMPTSAVL